MVTRRVSKAALNDLANAAGFQENQSNLERIQKKDTGRIWRVSWIRLPTGNGWF
jgi:hypothetical protein